MAIYCEDLDTANNANVYFRFNGDSGSNYKMMDYSSSGSTSPTFYGPIGTAQTQIWGSDARIGGSNLSDLIVNIYRYTDTARIMYTAQFIGAAASPSNQDWGVYAVGRYAASAAITSVTITNPNSESMTGTVYIYGVK